MSYYEVTIYHHASFSKICKIICKSISIWELIKMSSLVKISLLSLYFNSLNHQRKQNIIYSFHLFALNSVNVSSSSLCPRGHILIIWLQKKSFFEATYFDNLNTSMSNVVEFIFRFHSCQCEEDYNRCSVFPHSRQVESGWVFHLYQLRGLCQTLRVVWKTVRAHLEGLLMLCVSLIRNTRWTINFSRIFRFLLLILFTIHRNTGDCARKSAIIAVIKWNSIVWPICPHFVMNSQEEIDSHIMCCGCIQPENADVIEACAVAVWEGRIAFWMINYYNCTRL